MMEEENEIEELAPWLVLLITLVGGGLRVFALGSKGLWLDETFSIWIPSHNVAEMLQWIARIDHHPPLYYLLLHAWMALKGDGPADVRLLSALFGVGTIPIIYLIGKRISGATAGLAAALILALSPFHIRFAQEARMYTCLTFTAAVAIYALVWLLTDSRSARPVGSQFREALAALLKGRDPSEPFKPDTTREFSYREEVYNQPGWRGWVLRRIGRLRRLPIQAIETDLAWTGFIVFSAATMLSHHTAVLFPLATNLFILSLMLWQRRVGAERAESLPVFRSPSLANWVKALVGIFLLWSPWLPAFIRQASRVYQEFWIPEPGWESVLQAIEAFLNEPLPDQASQPVLIWILYALVFCLGLVYFLKEKSRQGSMRLLFLVVLFAVPFLGELAASVFQPVFLERTLIWTTVPLFLVLGAGIAQIRFRWLMVVVVGVLGTNNLFSAGDYFRFVQKEDWSNPAGYVANFVQEDDLILFHASRVQIPFDYYFRTYEKQYFLQVEKHGVPVDLFESGVLEARMTDSDIPRLIELSSGWKRVWLVYSHNLYTDPERLVPRTLAAGMKLIKQRDFYGVQVYLFEAP